MATFTEQVTDPNTGSVSWSTLSTGLPVLGTDYGDTESRAFFRYPSVTIPKGSTINSASLSFTRGWADTGSLGVAFRAMSHDSAPAFSTAASVTGAALAAASTTLSSTAAAWNTAGTTTVDVTEQVRAVVGRSGWVSGNALALLTVNAGTSGNGYFEVASNATLTVDYTPPVVETPPGTPTGLSVTPGETSAVVGWTGSAGATSYEIEHEPVAALSGTAAAAVTVTGSVTARRAASGTSTVTSGASGSIKARLRVAGVVAVSSAASGWLSGTGGLSGVSAVASTASGRVTARLRTAGTITVTSGSNGRLASSTLSGTVTVVSGASGALVPLAVPAGPPPEDFGLRLACFDATTGAERGKARAALIERYARAGEPGSLKVNFSELAPRSELFAAPVEAAVEYYDGTEWVEPKDARYVIAQDSHEHTGDPSASHDLTLVGITALLSGPKVFTAPPEQTQTDGKRQFLSKTPGEIIGTLLTEAKARGSVPTITAGFTATHDSNGQPWTAVYNRAYELNHSLLGILQNLYDGGAVDYWTQGRVLHMVPAGDRSRDLSTGVDPVYLRDLAVAGSPERADWTRLADVALLIGDEGATFTKTNPAAYAPFGRRETVILAGGVSDEGTATVMMDRALAEGADVARELTREWAWTPGTRWMPDRDLQLGDWALADTKAGTRQRVKVADLMTRQGPDGIEAFVTLGTIADDLMTRMAKRQLGIEGGAGVGSIGRPTLPPPPDPTSQWAERPDGFTVAVTAWPIPGGYGGILAASWQEVTTDTGGFAYTPDGYIVRARKQGGPWMDMFRTSALSGQVERTDMRPGETWEAQVAAYRGDQTGVFSPVWSGTVPEDVTPPPTPSAPILESPVAQVVVGWDGNAADGTDMPLDTKHVEVEVNAATDPERWRIGRGGGQLRLDPPAVTVGETVTVRLRAIDYAGNTSGWSTPGFIAVTASVAWPATPGSVLASADTYLTSEGGYRGRISVSWAEVTTDTGGDPLDITRYSVRARRTTGWFATDWFDLFSTTELSGVGSSPLMEVGDVWEVAVAAVSADGHTGPFSAAVAVTIPPDETPPPIPSTPALSSSLGMLTVEWDGLSQTGGGMDADLDYLDIVATGHGVLGRIDPRVRVEHLTDMTVGTTYEIRLVAVDRAGNESDPSQPATIQVVSEITGLAERADQIEADFAAADAALQGQIDSIIISSSGGNVTWAGATTPTAPAERPHTLGDVWYDTSTRTIKRYDGSAWIVHQVGDAGIFNLNAAKITTGFLDSARLKTDAAWVTNQLLVGNTDEVVVDPTWQNAALNTDRARAGWTVAPGVVTRTVASADDFWLGATSIWPGTTAHLALRPGVRYRIEARVRLTGGSGEVSLVRNDTAGGYFYITGPTALAANTDFVLVGEVVWGNSPGSLGVRLPRTGTIRDVSVRPMLSQVLIENGLITAPKIASAAITADKIDAGAVTAAKLSADALNFKTAEGLVLTAPNIQSTTTANRGLKLSTANKRVYDNAGNITLEEDYDTGSILMTGRFQTRGAYPHLDIGRGLWADFAGLQWTIGPGWQTKPEIITNASKWGADLAGGLYVRGGNRDGLTMRPELALRSGRTIGGVDSYWPTAELILGIGATTHGRRRLRDEGTNTTSIYDWANFIRYETKTGQAVILNEPGSPGDVRIASSSGGVLLQAGNGWITAQGIGTTAAGQDLALEGSWRLAYRSSMSHLKFDQQPIPPIPAVLALDPKSWVDRYKREEDPDYDTRNFGFIAEEAEALIASLPETDAFHVAPLVAYYDRGGQVNKSIPYGQLVALLWPLVRVLWEDRFGPIDGVEPQPRRAANARPRD